MNPHSICHDNPFKSRRRKHIAHQSRAVPPVNLAETAPRIRATVSARHWRARRLLKVSDHYWRSYHALSFTLLIAFSVASTCAPAKEEWVTSIVTSSQWAVFPCKNYWITTICGIDKDYSDAGFLPSPVSVGDTVTYIGKNGRRKQFVVRHISYFIYDKDRDLNAGGHPVITKRGETSCILYDVTNWSATLGSEYPSTIVIKNCRVRY